MEKENQENKIPVYKAEFNPDLEPGTGLGLSAIGIVDSPAIMENFIVLSKQPAHFKMQSEEKRLLMAPAMISGMRIYRVDPMYGEYYIYFDSDVIRNLVYKFFKDGLINKFNINHSETDSVQDVFIVESWFTSENSKEKEYGFNLPIGSWMITVRVENDAVWNEFVKTGQVKGFSIEALLRYVQVFVKHKAKFQESDSDELIMEKIISLFKQLE